LKFLLPERLNGKISTGGVQLRTGYCWPKQWQQPGRAGRRNAVEDVRIWSRMQRTIVDSWTADLSFVFVNPTADAVHQPTGDRGGFSRWLTCMSCMQICRKLFFPRLSSTILPTLTIR